MSADHQPPTPNGGTEQSPPETPLDSLRLELGATGRSVGLLLRQIRRMKAQFSPKSVSVRRGTGIFAPHSRPRRAWAKPSRSVPPPTSATGRWLGALFKSRRDSTSGFDEDRYLLFNRDVAAAVSEGRATSGWHHWLQHGQNEGRAGVPPERIPDRKHMGEAVAAKPPGINHYGFFSVTSGLGAAARGLGASIAAAGIPTVRIEVPNWERPTRSRHPAAPGPYRVNLISQNADVKRLFLREFSANVLAGHYNVGYWFWELPSLRLDLCDSFDALEAVWTASEFCRRAFQASTSLPVRVVPAAVAGLDSQATYGREHFGFPAGTFVFTCIFDVSSQLERKNPRAVIEAFRRAFRPSEDVQLFLKCTNGAYNPAGLAELRDLADADNIRLVDGVWAAADIHSLHKAGDCLVSAHRSEGFGLNLAEAMYFGKNVIGTGYGGNVDFMDGDNSYLIDYELRPLSERAGPYPAHSVWAEPSVDHLIDLMRRVFHDRDDRERKAKAGRRTIRERHSFEAVGRVVSERLGEFGLLDEQPSKTMRLHAHPAFRGAFRAAGTPDSAVAEFRSLQTVPVITIVSPLYNTPAKYLRLCFESVLKQWYPYWEFCICDDGSTNPETLAVLDEYQGRDPRIRIIRNAKNQGISTATNCAAELSTGEFLALLDSDDELTPEALLEMAKAINASPGAQVLYSDEDKLDMNGDLCDHYFKPDWSPDHLLSVNYFLHLVVVQKELFFRAGAFRKEYDWSQDYDLVLRLTSLTDRIVHVPKVLYHWRKIPGSSAETIDAKSKAFGASLRALNDLLAKSRTGAKAELGLLPGLFRVRYPVDPALRATLLVVSAGQTRDLPGRGPVNLLANFLRSVYERTEHRNFEVLIVSDGDLPPETKLAIAEFPHRLLAHHRDGREFNFARLVNFGFRNVLTEHVVLLNDDLEVITGEWLTALLEHTQRSEIGAAGPKLLFPDGRLQHAGLVLGVNGGAAHVYHSFPGSFVGYNAFTHVIRNYSALTAACLATKMELVKRVGGLDESFLFDYNDVDFCLRLGELGYRLVYTPHSVLYHLENVTRARREQTPAEVQRFCRRWPLHVEDDPYYNPNLARDRLDYFVDAGRSGWTGRT